MTPLGKTLKRAVKNKVAKVVAWVSSYLGPTLSVARALSRLPRGASVGQWQDDPATPPEKAPRVRRQRKSPPRSTKADDARPAITHRTPRKRS